MTCRAPGSASCTNPTPTGQSLTYDPLGQMLTWQSADGTASGQYADDGEGDRVWQRAANTSGGVTTTTTVTYVLGVEEITSVATSTGGSTTTTAMRYYGLAGGISAERDASGLSYLAHDLLGTPILTYHLDTGAVLGGQLRTPYGQARYADSAGANGGMHTTVGFTGQREDSAGAGIAGGSGLDDFHARYYDPADGRFTSADTVRGADPLGDAYAYVGGRVEVATDPSGHERDTTETVGDLTDTQWAARFSDEAMTDDHSALSLAVWHPDAWHQAQLYAQATGNDLYALDYRADREAFASRAAHPGFTATGPGAVSADGYFAVSGLAANALAASTGALSDVRAGADIRGDGGKTGGEGDLAGAGDDLAHLGDLQALEDDITAEKEAVHAAEEGAARAEAGQCGESFSPDTQVATPGGGAEAIGDLRVGDAVEAYDPRTGRASAQTVQRVFVDRDTDLLDLTPRPDGGTTGQQTHASGGAPTGRDSRDTHQSAGAGEVVRTTAKHPWLTADRGWVPADRGWVPAGALRPGERVRTLDGGTATVTAVRAAPGAAPMWDLTVSNLHTFAVGGGAYVVHNCGQVPQGLTQQQFANLSSTVRSGTAHIGSDDVVVQGSRAAFTAGPNSDIDIAVRVPSGQFDDLIADRFGSPNPGSAKLRTMEHAIATGKIQAGEMGLSGFRRSLERQFGMPVDLSVIRIGGPFDVGPTIPLW